MTKFEVGDIVTATTAAGPFVRPGTPLQVVVVYPNAETDSPYDCLDEATGDIYMMSDDGLAD